MTCREYYLKCLPAQVQLAQKMRNRGQLVSTGSRLEYVITTKGGHTAKQYEKVESLEYFNRHSRVLDIDYYYYLKQLANPLDQILDIIFTKDNNDNKYKYKEEFVLEQYNIRLQYVKVLKELKGLFGVNIIFQK
jgi:DNA polymerase elongation subunit (family B)